MFYRGEGLSTATKVELYQLLRGFVDKKEQILAVQAADRPNEGTGLTTQKIVQARWPAGKEERAQCDRQGMVLSPRSHGARSEATGRLAGCCSLGIDLDGSDQAGSWLDDCPLVVVIPLQGPTCGGWSSSSC